MNSKNINLVVSSLFLLVFGFAVLIGGNIQKEKKSDFLEGEISGTTASQSGDLEEKLSEPTLYHSGFARSDYRQEIVQEAYKLGGLDFVSLIECENGQWLTGAVGDYGKSHGLCMLNTRRHKEPLSPEWNDWRNQISVCFEKWKRGTKFYGPSRLIGVKKCGEVVKKRFYFM